MKELSAKHFIFFIFGVTFISYKTYPSIFISTGGRDTWLYTLIACVILMAFVMYLFNIVTSRKTYDLRDIFAKGLSKHVGNVFIFLFSIGLFLAALEAASVEANLIRTNFFIETPVWYTLFFFLLPSVFILDKHVTSFVAVVIITVSFLILNIFIFSILSATYRNINFLLPIFTDRFSSSMFITIFNMFGSLASFSIALPYLKFVTKESKLKRHTLVSLGIISFLIIYSTIGIISSFGHSRGANLFYPEFVQSQLIATGGFIEFGEFFFLLQSVLGLFLKYLIATYGIFILYHHKINNTKAFITLYTIIIFILGNFLSRDTYFLFDVLNFYPIINIIFFVAIPLIGFIAFQIKSQKKL